VDDGLLLFGSISVDAVAFGHFDAGVALEALSMAFRLAWPSPVIASTFQWVVWFF
jgi:hypothetical protein